MRTDNPSSSPSGVTASQRNGSPACPTANRQKSNTAAPVQFGEEVLLSAFRNGHS
ncbi:MAG: hypothetical protein IJ498_04140 [Akkermansia sp.]|nr:hypothetical protein [Akkermansia sp.]